MKQTLTLLAAFTLSIGFAQLPGMNTQPNVPSNMCGVKRDIVDCSEKLQFKKDGEFAYNKTTGKPFTGTCESCHFNGKVDTRITYLEGWIHDTIVSYYKSGNMRFMYIYNYGVKTGEWKTYYDSVVKSDLGGKARQLLSMVATYENGEYNGQVITYEIDGSVIKEENYVMGLKHGLSITYFPLEDGQAIDQQKPKKESNYEYGVLSGPFKIYTQPDSLLIEQNYLAVKQKKMYKSLKDGKFTAYYPNGQEKQIEHYSKDVKDGQFIWYFSDGDVEKEEFYKKGKPDGTWIIYFSKDKFDKTPKLKMEIVYKNGKLISKVEWDRFGEVVYDSATAEQAEEKAEGAEGDENSEATESE